MANGSVPPAESQPDSVPLDLAATLADHGTTPADGGVGTGVPDKIFPGRYEQVSVLGAGATGQVVALHDRTFDRVVAAKVLTSSNAPTAAQFIREARITASLEHPNIVPIHDLEFTAAGSVFFTMRRVTGQSLGDALREAVAGRVPAAIATVNDRITVILKVADALARAHAKGVIHQDIKPDNIMLGEHGEVLLVDWGEARLRGESRVQGHQPVTVGTPAYMSPEQARGEVSTELSDLYSLGATLFQSLLLRTPTWGHVEEIFWAKKCQGTIDPLTPEERGRVPPALLAITLRALEADPDHRYPSVVAFTADLVAFQAGLAVSAFREGVGPRLRRWLRRSARTLALSSALVAALGVAGWLALGNWLTELASWGRPVLQERFTPDWTTRWSLVTPGTFVARDGALMSTAMVQEAYLVYQPMITGGVAVEFSARILPDAQPGRISLVWLDAQGRDLPVPAKSRGLEIAIGAFFNDAASICTLPEGAYLQQRPLALERDRTYRMRIELDGRRIRLAVDGRNLLEDQLVLPLGPGHVGLGSQFPGVEFRDVTVWNKGVAQKVDILTIGDSFVQVGLLPQAADAYHRVVDSFPGTPVAAEAAWREGLARSRAGDAPGAEAAWLGLRDPALRAQVEARRLERTAEIGGILDPAAFTDLYRRAPDVRFWLRHLWTTRTANPALPSEGRRVQDPLLALRDELFSDDTTTAMMSCRLLVMQRRYEDVLFRHPTERRWNGYALMHLGRYDEALQRAGDILSVDLDVRHSRGEYELLASGARYSPTIRAAALVRLGRVTEAVAVLDGQATPRVLLALGRAAEVLEDPRRDAHEVAAALWVLDRLDADSVGREALPGRLSVGVGFLVSDDPMVALRHLPEDRQPATLMLLYRIRGEVALEREARARLKAQAPDFGEEATWFEEQVLPAVLDRLDGNPSSFLALDEAARTRWQGRWAGHLEPFTGYILGHCDEAQFLAQPCRGEAPVWLLLTKALRAEFAGDRPAALTAYRAWQELPRWRRLMGPIPRPAVVAERFVAWRAALLAAAHP